MKSPLPLGAHMSIAGELHLAFARGEKAGCTAMQIFTKNANQWRGKPISAEAAEKFRNAWQESPIGPVAAHDTYLINLAAPEDDKWEKSIAAFYDEVERCALLGIPHLVMHPGAHLGEGEEAGLKRVAAAFRRIFAESDPSVTVLLENTAGQGTYLGGKFEHLAALMDLVPEGRFGVCFDTCHAFAAGYDLASEEGFSEVMERFQHIVGLEKILLFHVNDSKKGLASHVDRHEHIGQGTIGRGGFQALMQDERLRQVPKILETPKGDQDEMDEVNLNLLRELAGEA